MRTTQELLTALKNAIAQEREEGLKLQEKLEALEITVQRLKDQIAALQNSVVELDSEELTETANKLDIINSDLEQLLVDIGNINPTPVSDALVDTVKSSSSGTTQAIEDYQTGTSDVVSSDVQNSTVQLLGEGLDQPVEASANTPGSTPVEPILIADSTIPTVPGTGDETSSTLTDNTFLRQSSTVGFSDPLLPSEGGVAEVTITEG